MNLNSIVHYFLLICYYILFIYYLLLIIYFIMGWIPALRYKKIYYFMEKIATPFNRLFMGKWIYRGLDLSSTLGIILYSSLLTFLERIL